MDNLDSEVRCEFLVDEKRKKLWNIELDILEKIEQICEKYDLQYFALGGASIGAVRHKGFIPWDDDMDIGMSREDLDVFLRVCKKEFPSYYCVQYGLNKEGSFNGFCRVRDSRTTGILRADAEKGGNGGIFVEIYPYDNVPNNKVLAKIQVEISNYLYTGLGYKFYKNHLNLNFMKKIFLLPMKFLSAEKIWKLYEANCRIYNNSKKCVIKDTISLPQYAKKNKYYYKIVDIRETEKLLFEDIEIRVPQNLKYYLKLQYGNYMEYPPIEERGTHHEHIVFYDPDKAYTEYYGTKQLKEYFR